MVITCANRYEKAKSIQPDNQEQATIIECINVSGWCISPFIIIKGAYHLSNWTTDSDFLDNWIIKSTDNGWTNNKAWN